MEIGIDIHNVIDRYPVLFKELSYRWRDNGHKIHIITGQEWEDAEPIVKRFGILYDYHFSIVDHHKKLGTEMYKRSDRKGWWVDNLTWNRSKGDYATANKIDLHFDDQVEYAEYFPNYCTFVLVPSINFFLCLPLIS